MVIYIVTPGHFYEGFNSRVRGEGRWLVHIAGVLCNQGHDVAIISTDLIRPYKDRGVLFTSIYNEMPAECDIMFSMDAWSDVPHLHKTKWSTMLEFYKPKKRVLALFFPTDPSVYDYLPVIHPWNYEQVRQGLGHCLPIITHEHCQPPAFDKERIHWFSKHPDENPEYLLGAIMAAHRLVFTHGASALFVDGSYIQNSPYRNCSPEKEQSVKKLYGEMLETGRIESLGNWAPYDFVRDSMSKTKMLLGIHHPVCAPSMVEAAAHGAFPVLFGNQASVAPYDTIDLPHIPLGSTDTEIVDFILQAWNDKDLFETTVLACQEAVQPHRQSKASVIIKKFLEEL